MTARTIETGTVVTVHHVLRDETGLELGRTTAGRPLVFLQGFPGVPRGLQESLRGHRAGDRVLATVAPADGYGERDPAGVQRIPRELVPRGAPLAVGQHLVVDAPDGGDHVVWITAVDDDGLTVDFNHPLAGVTLHFEVEIVDVRPATAAEIEAGRPDGGGAP